MHKLIKDPSKLLIPGSILISGILIAASLYFGAIHSQNAKDTASAQAPATPHISSVTAQDHILGNINAKALIIEYSDLECPFCKQLHATLHQVMDAHAKTGDVAWVYRHFPLENLHPRAPKEAEASECAAELGGNDIFWKYIDKIYAITPSNNKLDPSELPKIAQELGLDSKAFATCLASGKYAEKVSKQASEPKDSGTHGTPYSIIVVNKRMKVIPGAVPYEEMERLITSALTAK